MRHRILLHIVWTTRDRRPLIGPRVAGFLDESLRQIAWRERARILAVGIVSTHLHVLLRVHPTTNIPRTVQRMKGSTETMSNKARIADPGELLWAKGYNIESVSTRALSAATEYIRNQHRHHPTDAIPGWPRIPPP